MASKVQSLILSAIRAARQGAAQPHTFGSSVQAVRPGACYGYFPPPNRCRGEVKVAARMMTRYILPCGGCNNGRVPKRDERGQKVGNWGNWPVHSDCDGLGLRLNRRYGRCGNGKLR